MENDSSFSNKKTIVKELIYLWQKLNGDKNFNFLAFWSFEIDQQQNEQWEQFQNQIVTFCQILD